MFGVAKGQIQTVLGAHGEPANGLSGWCDDCSPCTGQLGAAVGAPRGDLGSRGGHLARPCPGWLQAGKTIELIMGDPGELRIFWEYISPSE